jgi:hypothetical protein
MTSDTAKRVAIQLASQLPEEPADQQLVLMFLHELMEWLNDARPDPAANGTGNVVSPRRPSA